jgi:predicted GNAT family N-acyltransferase
MSIRVESRAPKVSSEAEMAAFCRLVREYGQVHDDGLEERVLRARRLVFLRDDDVLAGTAAIKDPTQHHRRNVFRKAGAADIDSGYVLELGYVVVAEAYQGRKLSRVLVNTALEGFASTPLFATSRASKGRMHSTLKRFAFRQVGDAYASEEEDEKVLLFVRDAAEESRDDDAASPKQP